MPDSSDSTPSSAASAQHEYYIRQPSENEAGGPFTYAQMRELAASGGLNARTLYYDASGEQWLPVSSAPELRALVPGASVSRAGATANTPAAPAASAAGNPDAGALAPRLVPALLAVSALAFLAPVFVAPGAAGENAGIPGAFLDHPFAWLGALDVLLTILAAIFAAKIFKIIRLRAALGLGFLCLLFWLQERPAPLALSAIACASLWLATFFVKRGALVANAIAGLAALAALAYCLLS